MQRSLVLTFVCLGLSFFTMAQKPVPVFSASPISGCSPLVVAFTDNSRGNPTAWYWDFGNGATSTLQHPSTTYFIPGTYTVRLRVTNLDGSDSVIMSNLITVYAKPEVSFQANDSAGCFPFPVQFTDLSKASAGTANNSWVWDFGDGTQSTTQNPQQTYLNNGNYTVSLKVVNDKGCWSTATKQSYIKISGGVKAGFSHINSLSCKAPFVLQFTNASTGPGQLSYTWLWGDGTQSTSANPLHTYTTPGVYSVTLITESSKGCRDTLRKDALLDLKDVVASFTAPDSICENEAIKLTNTSSPNPLASLWNFGDGTSSSLLNPVKTFTSPGTFRIKLVQSYGACVDTASKTVHVFARPKAAFDADKKGACQPPLTVNFTNNSSNAVSYHWTFGDGTSSDEAAPSHTYTKYGNYTVTLVTVNESGCTDSVKLPGYININEPVIRFDSLPAQGCLPFTHTFHATVGAGDSVASYFWNAGNGATSTSSTPTFTYSNQGVYTVSLTIVTQGGCKKTDSLPAAISTGRKPVVEFSPQPDEICAFQQLHFTNTTSEGDEWYWSFGDGGHSTESNPHYQYKDTGTFFVTLIVKNHGCEETFQFPHSITVRPPIARFAYTTNCVNKLVCSFKNQSIGANSYTWNFGDGTQSFDENPVHTFPAYGTYKVKLTVSNATCYHETETTVTLANSAASFSVSPPVLCKGTSTIFTADTTNAANIVSYTWDFGNGAPPVQGRTVTAVYPKNGSYTVSLTVKDINGCVDSIVKRNIVHVNGPFAGMKKADTVTCRGLSVTFTDVSKADAQSKLVTWKWDMGDGTIITDSTPAPVRHLYSQIETVRAGLEVTDESGCKDTTSLLVVVRKDGILADFVSADTVSCPGATIHFRNTSTVPSAYTSQWSFGDGSSATVQDPAMQYKADGRYTVTLTINDGNGCTDTVSKPAYISIKHPVASFTVNDSASSCIPFKVQYTNTSAYYIQHVWDLNGGTSLIDNPLQYYNQPGVYQTKLIVTSPGGCTDTATKNIYVYDISNAKLSYLPLSGCKPLNLDIRLTTPNKTSYVWDFGDGSIINNNDTTGKHVYNAFGDFVPKVIIKDQGCVIPITGKDTIRIIGATAKFGVNTQLLCDSGTVKFIDSTTFNNPLSYYNWNFGDGSTSSQPAPSHRFAQPGIYNVSLNVLTQSLCVDTFRLKYPIKVVASPVVHIEGDSVICAGEGIQHAGIFERKDTSAVQWTWKFPNGKVSHIQTPPMQYYKEPGRFRVQALAANSSGCKDTAYQNILVNPIPFVKLPSSLTVMQGSSVLIPAIYSDEMRSYQWNMPDGLSCTTCPQPMAGPKANTKYNVTFVDKNGCHNTGEVQVIVLCNNDNVFVPNTFSPNGDGSNDVFYVRGKGLSRVKTLRIFNRWGQVVFERTNFSVNDASMGWDGTFKGAKPIPGVYVYQLEIFCENSQVIQFEGNVTLIQ